MSANPLKQARLRIQAIHGGGGLPCDSVDPEGPLCFDHPCEWMMQAAIAVPHGDRVNLISVAGNESRPISRMINGLVQQMQAIRRECPTECVDVNTAIPSLEDSRETMPNASF